MSGGTNNEKEALWMAYLDGQMTASESSAFDSSLTPEDRERLAAEMRLEAGLAERLCQCPACPEALWKRLELQMNNGAARRRRTSLTFAAAAAVALVIGTAWFGGIASGLFPGKYDNTVGAVSGLAIPDETPEAFAAHAETPAPATREATEKFLLDNNIHLAINDYHEVNPKSRHDVRLVGACKGNCPERTLYEVLFTCCGQPVKIVIAKKGTGGDKMIGKARKCGEIQDMVGMGEYTVAVVGKHPAPDLIDVIRPRPDAIV